MKEIKQIGKGSFSNVFLYNDNFVGDYIIKEINLNLLVNKYNNRKNESDEKYYYTILDELINSEIDILTKIHHNNIVKYIDHSKKNGIYYISMEFCCDGDVYSLLKQNKEIKFNTFLKHTSNALMYLKEENIIHRDIKLHNILVNNNIYKISDFGFACYDNSELVKKGYSTNGVLCEKYYKLCGSPMYMAPEIILNAFLLDNFTMKSNRKKQNKLFYNINIDLWSFGLCLYELQTKSLPLPSAKSINDLEIFYNKKEEAQEYINNKVNDNIKLEWRELILKLLQVDKEKRANIIYVKNYKYKENIEKINEDLKQHIVYNTIDTNINDSWQEVDSSSSIYKEQNTIFNWFF